MVTAPVAITITLWIFGLALRRLADRAAGGVGGGLALEAAAVIGPGGLGQRGDALLRRLPAHRQSLEPVGGVVFRAVAGVGIDDRRPFARGVVAAGQGEQRDGGEDRFHGFALCPVKPRARLDYKPARSSVVE